MIQEVLTYIIVALAFSYVIYKIVRLFFIKSQAEALGCSGCSCDKKKQFTKK